MWAEEVVSSPWGPLDTARRTLEDVDAAFRRLKTRCLGETGQLGIGVYASLSTGNMHATLVEHHRRFPEVEVHTVDRSHDRPLCALTANVVDVAIMKAEPGICQVATS